jgi:hypothetical protein
VFADFAHDGRVLDLVDGLLGADIDLFLSQFTPQRRAPRRSPDHQVGVWLAVTEATLDNGASGSCPARTPSPCTEDLVNDWVSARRATG